MDIFLCFEKVSFLFLFVKFFWGYYICLCSGVTLGSVLTDHFWQYLDHVWCRDQTIDWMQANTCFLLSSRPWQSFLLDPDWSPIYFPFPLFMALIEIYFTCCKIYTSKGSSGFSMESCITKLSQVGFICAVSSSLHPVIYVWGRFCHVGLCN